MRSPQKSRLLDIGQVAEQSGMPASTLRYYEEQGLIRSVSRNGLRRLFPAQVMEQLEFIALGREGGFSLAEISAMFAEDGDLRINRKLLLRQAEQMDRQIQKLAAIRDGLRHVAKCQAPRHLECPKFQRLLRVSGRSAARARRKG